MIRRFTSAQFVPANAGAKAKNPVGSTLFSTPMVALLRHPGHKILRTCCRESARKRLIISLYAFGGFFTIQRSAAFFDEIGCSGEQHAPAIFDESEAESCRKVALAPARRPEQQ